MYKLYVALLIGFFKVSSVQSGENDPVSSSSSPNILPLVMINLGESSIIPDKIDTLEKLKDTGDFSGKTKFSALNKPNGQQVFMCAKEDLSDTKPSNIEKYCLISMKFDESDPLKCTHEPRPIISKYIQWTGKITLNDVPCGPGKNGKIYRLVYKICMTDEPNPKEEQIVHILGQSFASWKTGPTTYESEVEIYRFCYVHEEGVLYTEHTISSLELLNDERLQQERDRTFPISFDPSNPFNFSVENMRNNYDRMDSFKKAYDRMESWIVDYNKVPTPRIEENKILDSSASTSPSTTNRQILYRQEKLVPSGDFAFALWRKATYSFFNFRRMRTDLVNVWDHISFLIRQNAIELNREYHIHTSVFKLTLPQPQTRNQQTLAPNVWMKKIYYFYGEPEGVHKLKKVKAIAILMNGYFDTGNSEAAGMIQNRCKKNMCEGAFTKIFPKEGKSILCCTMINNTDLQEEAVEVYDNLEVDFLQRESEMKRKRDDSSRADQDALLSEIKRRNARDNSPSYDPMRQKMESMDTD